MAYEKQTWTTGEVITQEKLNHMEQGIANAGGDAGYECEETVYFDGDVVVEEHSDGQGHTWTSGEFATTPPKVLIGLDELNIVLNGEEYTLPKTGGDDNYAAFTIYSPQYIMISVGGNFESCSLSINVAGTYSLTIATHSIVSVSGCFKMAVEDSVPEERYTYFEINGSDFGGYNTSISRQELFELVDDGKANRLVALPQFDALAECHFGGGMTQGDGICFIGLKSAANDGGKEGVAVLMYTIPRSGDIKRKQVQLTTWEVNA